MKTIVEKWNESETFKLLKNCIQQNMEHPVLCTEETPITNYFSQIQHQLQKFNDLDFSNARYGSKAFQEMLCSAQEEAQKMLYEYSHVEYLLAAFGNPTRLDFGTGHELQFIVFLAHNPQLPFYSSLSAYLRCQRRIIKAFRLEPAGSKGVWGLDDYFFAPYLFGAAQLAKDSVCTPEQAITSQTDNNEGDYLYLWAVDCTRQDKGPRFAEHSPMLWDISGLPSWAKIRDGLLKMYDKEVLQNEKIIQNFFSSCVE